VQSSFEKLWINCGQVDYARSKSYLFTIAYHQMIDHIRKRKRVYLSEFQEEAPVQDSPVPGAKSILQEALGRLNEIQKSLVMLKDYEGYSYEEIGEITGLNPSQVKVYLHRARTQLRTFIVKKENVL
jgi:RNA polymerase sigma factor (sigma-70 family)